jgi:hypothetical protein
VHILKKRKSEKDLVAKQPRRTVRCRVFFHRERVR